MVIAVHLLAAIIARLRHYFTRPSWFSEVGSGLATLGWGLLVLNVDNADDWPSSTLLFQLNKSAVWGALAVILGLGQMFLFQMVDRHWQRPWLRWGTAMIVAWIWGAITISTARADPWPPSLAAYFAWWVVNVYLISRIFWSRDWTM